MKTLPFFLALLLTPFLFAQDAQHPEKAAAATTAATAPSDADKSVLFIEPKGRASDYVQAFELLRKDKPSTKITLRTKTGTPLALNDLTSSANGTLLFAKIPSNTGSKYLIVPIEEIVELAYSPN